MKTMPVVEAFEAAVRAHEMKGAARPEEQHEIEQDYLLAREALLQNIRHHMERADLYSRYRSPDTTGQ